MRRSSAPVALLSMIGLIVGLTAPVPARLPEEAGCSWPLKLDTMNFAYPDTSAQYWMTHFGDVPASRLVIKGRYPQARYFSFHAYDEAQRPVGSIADFQIAPDEGANPFRPGGGREGTYTVKVVFEPRPKNPKPNTVYAGEMDNGAPNPAGFVVYRIYIPDDPAERTGSVPLPSVTLETADGNVRLPLGHCEPLPPPAGDRLDEEIRRSNYPLGRNSHVIGTEDPPRWKVFYGADREFRDWCGQGPCDEGPKMRGGFLSNQHISYLYARISREYGEVVVVRMKPPTAPDTRSGETPASNTDVRYWSLCQNNDASQRVVGCSADHQTVVGADGFATFVISDPEDRPRNATRANGINYLEWGAAYYSGILIYRHMLPDASFREAIQNVEEGTPPHEVMRSYMPRAAYCDKQVFIRGGSEACFARAASD